MTQIQNVSKFTKLVNTLYWTKNGDDMIAEFITDDIQTFATLAWFEFGVEPEVKEIEGGHRIKFYATDLPRLRADGLLFLGADEEPSSEDMCYRS